MARRVILLLLILLAAGAYGWFDVRRRARIDRGPRFHRTDFTVYSSAARALADGKDPYSVRNPRGYRYVYPPLLAILLLPVARWAPPDAAFLFYLLSLAALGASVWLLARMRFGRAEAPVGWRAVGIALVLCAGFAHQGFQRGQITHVLLFTQVAALLLCLRCRYVPAGLLLAFGTALRLTPALAAAVVGLGLLADMRRSGPRPMLRFGLAFGLGLCLCLWVVPVLALGFARAAEVNRRFGAVTQSLYIDPPGAQQLLREYKINEFRFKNQAPRRVAATWVGALTGAAFERERPRLTDRGWAQVDWIARGIGLLVVGLLAWLAWRHMRGPPGSAFAMGYALAVFAPVLITRYTWPTHELMALPILALLAASAGRGVRASRVALGVFLIATALFYAAHLRGLQFLGAVGPLLFAAAWVLVTVARSVQREPT